MRTKVGWICPGCQIGLGKPEMLEFPIGVNPMEIMRAVQAKHREMNKVCEWGRPETIVMISAAPASIPADFFAELTQSPPPQSRSSILGAARRFARPWRR